MSSLFAPCDPGAAAGIPVIEPLTRTTSVREPGYTGPVTGYTFLTPRRVLRGLGFGFAVVVLLLIAAVYMGYQGSRAIHDNARELVRQHMLTPGPGADLERRIEEQSQQLLDELELVLGLCLATALTSAAMTIWITRRAFERLAWHADELARVSWQMLQDQETTARRFSHEMHDELGQALTGLRGMLKQLSAADFDVRRAECVGILDEALTGVRELSQLLRPVILDDFGIDAALRWLVERFAQRTGIDARYTSDFHGRLVDDVETNLFRIAQEALTNVARHAQASKASVALLWADGVVTLTVDDNGRGMPPQRSASLGGAGLGSAGLGSGGPSLGMVGMRARARHIGGELQVESVAGRGVWLRVRAPAPLRAEIDESHEEDAHPAR